MVSTKASNPFHLSLLKITLYYSLPKVSFPNARSFPTNTVCAICSHWNLCLATSYPPFKFTSSLFSSKLSLGHFLFPKLRGCSCFHPSCWVHSMLLKAALLIKVSRCYFSNSWVWKRSSLLWLSFIPRTLCLSLPNSYHFSIFLIFMVLYQLLDNF